MGLLCFVTICQLSCCLSPSFPRPCRLSSENVLFQILHLLRCIRLASLELGHFICFMGGQGHTHYINALLDGSTYLFSSGSWPIFARFLTWAFDQT